MVPPLFLGLALATALGGVSSFAVAAEPASIALAVGAVAATLAGVVLLVARRRGSAAGAADQQRSSEATDQAVSAALTRRMVNRGRLRVDDEVLTGSSSAPSARAARRSGKRSD